MITETIIKNTIKDYKNTEDSKTRSKYGSVAAIVGISTNFLLAFSKLLLGLIASSISIAADGINNLTDATSSAITLIGFRMSQKPGDKDHPYGHARSEYIAGMIVSVLIVVVGIELFRSSFLKILHPAEIKSSIWVYIILLLSVIVKLWQSRFYHKIASMISSVALEATATDSRNDVITTSAVIIGMCIYHFTKFNIDGYVGCFVAIFIIKSGYDLIKDTASPLLGEAPDSELVQFIKDKTTKFPGVFGVHDLVVHNYGPGEIFASIHVEVDSRTDIMISHELIDDIEKAFLDDYDIHITCHLDPIEIDNPKLDLISEIIFDEVKNWEGLCNPHDIRIVPGKNHSNIIFEIVEERNSNVDISAATKAFSSRLKSIDPTFEVNIRFEPDYTGAK